MATDIAKCACDHFSGGYNCAQSVFMALASQYGLDEETAVRVATGFGSGMARGETCGAVSGALMAFGLAGGGGGPKGKAAKAATYDRIRIFYQRFTELHGSCVCRELLGVDPSTPEGHAIAQNEKRFASVCGRLVSDAAMLVQAILEANPSPRS